ncbi:MAG: SMC-Scp complex subunit ScpB [Acidobacteria bacterium]|nr:SMC-Scp complex subunit ScpB [Acidobacteriota bacterium]
MDERLEQVEMPAQLAEDTRTAGETAPVEPDNQHAQVVEMGEVPQTEAEAEMTAEDLMGDTSTEQATEASTAEANLRAVIEAVIYVTEEPLTIDQIATALELSKERVEEILKLIEEECARPERGVSMREVAGGYKMGTKPEHHEAIRAFVKKLRPPFKLSLAALETLAVIAYKQPITAPEIMEVRGVQGAGVVKTLLDRKLITPAGRKQVVGKPILYKTTKEFLLQFGLKDLAELPTLKEFEELRRLVSDDDVTPMDAPAQPPPSPQGPQPQELPEQESMLEAVSAEPVAEAPSDEPATVEAAPEQAQKDESPAATE